MRDRISRREALTLALTAAAGTLVRPSQAAAGATSAASATQSATGAGAKTGASGLSLIIRNARPLDAEAPIEALRTFETDNDLFFVRSHHLPPTEPATDAWTLTIDGDVNKPITLTLAELRRMRKVHFAATLECAGNGRGRFNLPATSGVQWQYGAVSNAVWSGVSLGDLLLHVGVREEALHFWMEAADRSPMPTAPKFLRSIPREKAVGTCLVAYEMNGEPLPYLHGGPLRLVVGGWYGMAWTKWLTHIHARPVESDNHFMIRGYRWADGSPVNFMRVKSLITSPREGDAVRPGTAKVTGVAWTGRGVVSRVEISSDDGKTWKDCSFLTDALPNTWRQWEAEVPLTAGGEQRVRARATDSNGETQPDQAQANPAGYGNNSIHEVRFHAR